MSSFPISMRSGDAEFLIVVVLDFVYILISKAGKFQLDVTRNLNEICDLILEKSRWRKILRAS